MKTARAYLGDARNMSNGGLTYRRPADIAVLPKTTPLTAGHGGKPVGYLKNIRRDETGIYAEAVVSDDINCSGLSVEWDVFGEPKTDHFGVKHFDNVQLGRVAVTSQPACNTSYLIF